MKNLIFFQSDASCPIDSEELSSDDDDDDEDDENDIDVENALVIQSSLNFK